MGTGVDILGGSVGRIVLADNLAVLGSLPDDSIDLVYVDPPFNTGKRQTLRRLRTVRDDEAGDRTGFGGRRYRTIQLGSTSYVDVHDDYLDFLGPRLVEIHRVLRPSGSLYLHLDPREAHYAKVLCDAIFGRECFLNEVIWAYDYGARTRKRWPPKHDNILVYVIRGCTGSTPRPWSGSRTWRPGSWGPKRPPAASSRPTRGGRR
jgi:site-specific DNA-methyltransferase (adenine-specific)